MVMRSIIFSLVGSEIVGHGTPPPPRKMLLHT